MLNNRIQAARMLQPELRANEAILEEASIAALQLQLKAFEARKLAGEKLFHVGKDGFDSLNKVQAALAEARGHLFDAHRAFHVSAVDDLRLDPRMWGPEQTMPTGRADIDAPAERHLAVVAAA